MRGDAYDCINDDDDDDDQGENSFFLPFLSVFFMPTDGWQRQSSNRVSLFIIILGKSKHFT